MKAVLMTGAGGREVLQVAEVESLSFAEAAAAPLVLLTAWESLHDRVQVKKGDRVLIHADAAAAHALQEEGHMTGKIALTIDQGNEGHSRRRAFGMHGPCRCEGIKPPNGNTRSARRGAPGACLASGP